MGIKTLLWNGDASSSAKVVNGAWRWGGSRRTRMDRVLFGRAVCGCQAGWAERAHGSGLCSAWVRVPGCWRGDPRPSVGDLMALNELFLGKSVLEPATPPFHFLQGNLTVML